MSQPTTSILLNSTTPAAPAGNQNVKPQSDGGTPLQKITFYPQRATSSLLGVVKPDGTTIDVAADGTISVVGGTSGGGTSGGGTSGGGGLFSGLISSVPTQANTGLTTAYNRSTTFTISDTAAGIAMSDVSFSGVSLEGALKAYPGAPFQLNALMSIPAVWSAYSQFMLIIADSLSGPAMTFGLQLDGGVLNVVNEFSTPTSAVSPPYAPPLQYWPSFIWLHLKDDGTNISYGISSDGVNITWVYTISKAASFLGASGFNYIGFGILNAYSAVSTTLMAWSGA